jgi:hypothetical protein
MTPEELNHLKCFETENKLLVRHNKDLMRENLILKIKVEELEKKIYNNRQNRRYKNKL